MKITKRDQADLDINGHLAHLTRKSGTDLAVRFLMSFERTIDNIARMPGIGSPYEVDVASLNGLRCIPIDGFPNHLLFYLWPSADEIVIVRIIHGARNLERQLNRFDDG